MRVLAKKAPSPVRAVVPEPKPAAESFAFPAPTNGLVLNKNIYTPSPASAQVLDNWICSPTGVKVRGGSQKYATLPGPVTAMFSYRSGAGQLFAATATGVYDVSSAPDPEGAAVQFTGQTGGQYAATMFGTAGDDFLYVVNGSDRPRLFDGAVWKAIDDVSVPAITGVVTSKLSHVWSFANRLFFVEKGTMVAHYLPVDQIGGAVGQFSLAGVFKLGGSLLFGATWSRDSGSGMDDRCVFVSTQGEVAVCEGTNPGSATDWRVVGVYQISQPLGINAVMRAGGDLLIATQSGLVPLSQAVEKDPAALSMGAVSARIEPLWTDYVAKYDSPWAIAKWPEMGIMLVSMAATGLDDIMLCCNLLTGAWSRWTNIGARCVEHFSGFVYAGGQDGIVKRLQTGGNDLGAIYTAVYVGAHEGMAAPSVQKTAIQARALFRTSHEINPKITVQTNYLIEVSAPPAAIADSTAGVWDSARWDEDTWDGNAAAAALSSHWRALGRSGYSLAPELQLSFGSIVPPDVELVNIDMTYAVGAMVA